MAPSGHDGVLFDIGGVLLDLESVREGHDAFARALADRHDIDDADALAERWRGALGEYFGSREGTEYRPAREGYAVAVERAVGRPMAESEWFDLFVEATTERLRPVEGAVKTVERLDEAGYYLGVVSDIDSREGERILRSFGIRDRFADVTTSEAVGRTKPDSAMFETALAAAGLDAGRCLYVGDRYHNDMRGGARAGLRTVAMDADAARENGVHDPDGVVDHVVGGPRELLDLLGEAVE
jgi:putative hydrolase of the HAD superfamily